MTLSQKQCHFAYLIAQLIIWAKQQGYDVRFDEAYRTPEQAAINAKKGIGIANTLHTQHLAIDLSLYINGIYQADSATYTPLGVFWESMDPLARWGGRFTRKDGNHFSLEHEGVK